VSLWARFKSTIKNLLLNQGIYVRRKKGLPRGADLFVDLQRVGLLPTDAVMDIGAHHGESAIEYAQLFPSCAIFSFEPVHENFLALKENVSRYKNVKCFELALAATAGESEIFINDDSQTHSLKYSYREDDQAERQWVHLETVDGIVTKFGISRVGLLKIDVEGMELDVLNGASRSLESKLVEAILLEATLDKGDPIHTHLAPLQEYLGQHSYCLVSIYDQVTWTKPTRLAYFNALFVRDSEPVRFPLST
jgi:FkbM family methyltransferase